MSTPIFAAKISSKYYWQDIGIIIIIILFLLSLLWIYFHKSKNKYYLNKCLIFLI